MDQKTKMNIEAQNAARGQEKNLKKYRDMYLKKCELEAQAAEFKKAMAAMEERFDFSGCTEEKDGKITGRLRLPDDSFQLTKTISTKEGIKVEEVMADVRLRDKLESAGFIVNVPVLQVKEVLANEGARKMAVKYLTSEDVTKITATVNPK